MTDFIEFICMLASIPLIMFILKIIVDFAN
jgi:hypothetical protein